VITTTTTRSAATSAVNATTNLNATEILRTLFIVRSLCTTQLQQSHTQKQATSSHHQQPSHSHLLRHFASSASQLPKADVFDDPFASLQSLESSNFAPYNAADYKRLHEPMDYRRPPPMDEVGSRFGGRPLGKGGRQGGGLDYDQSNADLGDPESSASLLGERTDVSKPPVMDENGEISLDPEHFPMCSALRETLREVYKIEKFYPVQANCFHPIANGKDVIGRSHTGTGKTLAFVLPIVQRLINLNVTPRPGEGTILVIEPTRELANQVASEIRKLSSKVRVVTVFGGVSYENQRRMIAHGVDIVVGTPGRLTDLVKQGYASFQNSHTVILDEADEMLRMGFRQQIEEILLYTRPDRQILLFSATLPQWVKEVTRKHLRSPMVIDMVAAGDDTPTTIQHYAIAAPPHFRSRCDVIKELINHSKGRVIIFVNRKSDADRFSEAIVGIRSGALHGDMSQNARDRVMRDFRNGVTKVLVCITVPIYGNLNFLFSHFISYCIDERLGCMNEYFPFLTPIPLHIFLSNG
jgi:hypothetical protein